MTFEQRIWLILRDKGLKDNQIAGIMGNLRAESGLIPYRIEGDFSKGYSASLQYTEDVDSGKVSKDDFIYKKPIINGKKYGPGYGLAQWTYWSRKKALYEFAKTNGTSISDLGMQIEFLWKELSNGSLIESIKKTETVKQASDLILHKFERPADQSASVELTRASMGNEYYQRYSSVKNEQWDIIKAQEKQNEIKTNKENLDNKKAEESTNQNTSQIKEVEKLAPIKPIVYTDDMLMTITILGNQTIIQDFQTYLNLNSGDELKAFETLVKYNNEFARYQLYDFVKDLMKQKPKDVDEPVNTFEPSINKNKTTAETPKQKTDTNMFTDKAKTNDIFSWPLATAGDTVVTSKFGEGLAGVRKGHQGVDLRASTGTSIYAAANGEVIFAGWDSKNIYGNYIKIKHKDGYTTLYAHLSKIEPGIRNGTLVTAGTKIGEAGSTGRSTAAHLHFEIRKDNTALNPINYLPNFKGNYK